MAPRTPAYILPDAAYLRYRHFIFTLMLVNANAAFCCHAAMPRQTVAASAAMLPIDYAYAMRCRYMRASSR